MQVSPVRITIGGHEEKIGHEIMRMFAEFAYQGNCMSAQSFVDLIVATRSRSCRKINGMTGISFLFFLLFFFIPLFFSTDGILEERGTSMAG
jgi:hypothetical protein